MLFKLMIVDDDEMLLEGMSTAVDWRSQGFEVCCTATDGRQALERLRDHDCDAVLTDIRMGRMDGLELTEAIRDSFPDMPVAMMSAYEDFSYAHRAMRLGVTDYLLKPIDLKQLYETMAKLRNRLREKAARQADGMIDIDSEAYRRASSALDTSLIDAVCATCLDGNKEGTMRGIERLCQHMARISGRSFLFFITVINMLAGRLHMSGKLSDEQRRKLERMQNEALVSGRFDDGMAIVRDYFSMLAGEMSGNAETTDPLISRAEAYINENLGNSALRLRDTAAHVGMSVNYFSGIFAKAMGESFSDHVIRRRMERAKELMKNPVLRTYEIAAMVGYDNAAYFSAAFKKYAGLNVSQYRKSVADKHGQKSDKI